METIYQDKSYDYLDLSSKCFIGVKFVNCSFRFCNFTNSDLSYAKFESCDLYCSVFKGSVLYFTRIVNCDATKANFGQSYLNGIRVYDTTITFAEFGLSFDTGKERKTQKMINVSEDYYRCSLQQTILPIQEIENNYSGIICLDNQIAIKFIETDDSEWKVWRRKSEIANVVKKIFEDNGYSDISINYYFLFRRFLRKSKKNPIYRLADYLFGELFWGYGVKILHPVIAFFVNCFFFSVVYSLLPLFSNSSGMKMSGEILVVYCEATGLNFFTYLEILYGSILMSALSVFGDMDIVGNARIFAVFHVLISVLSIGLGLTAFSKKMANA